MPYISFVIAGRNDDYGGDFNERLENSVHSLSRWTEKYQLPAEYIIVNYNPLLDRPSLTETLNWPSNQKYLNIRIITVPEEVHQSFHEPEIRKPVPLYEYIAKNIGTRRAKGEFICAANPDIIYDPRLIQFLSKKQLKADSYYRVDRCDFRKFDLDIVNDPHHVSKIRKRTYKIFLKGNKYDKEEHSALAPRLAFLRLWNRIRLYVDIHIPKEGKWELWADRLGYDFVRDNAEFFYHCNVSGDFFMMHRDSWERMKGQPENTYLALHTDAFMIIATAMAGFKEVVLPWPIYHQDHGRRYDADQSDRVKMLRDAYRWFQDKAQWMLQNQQTIIRNDENWGLKGVNLPEESI